MSSPRLLPLSFPQVIGSAQNSTLWAGRERGGGGQLQIIRLPDVQFVVIVGVGVMGRAGHFSGNQSGPLLL